MKELTYGEKLVGLTFNPSNDENVQKIKVLYAQIIDELDGLRKSEGMNDQFQRYLSIAITEAQTAQMRAVKAATAK